MTARRTLRKLKRAARGDKRQYTALVITLVLVLYLAVRAPMILVEHIFEVVDILLIATLIDVVKGKSEAPPTKLRTDERKLLEGSGDEDNV